MDYISSSEPQVLFSLGSNPLPQAVRPECPTTRLTTELLPALLADAQQLLPRVASAANGQSASLQHRRRSNNWAR